MNYRIIKETQRDGKEWFYVQKRFWGYFWRYFTICKGMDMRNERRAFNTKQEAERRIQEDVNWEYSKWQKEIINKQILE